MSKTLDLLINWHYTDDRLGNSGLKISRIILGGMSFGSKKHRPWVIEDEETVFGLLKLAYDAGIRTWDTADTYCQGESERLIGKFLKEYKIPRSTVTIMTKVWFPMNVDGCEVDEATMANRFGLSRKHIMDAIDESMERLGTYIDVYQIHRFDDTTGMLETMQALHDCVKAGKTRYIGASSMPAHKFAMLQFTAEKHGLTKFVSMQNLYNLIHREEEREMIPFCEETGVGLIPYSPNAGGVLARPLDVLESERAQTDGGVRNNLKFGQQPGDEEIIKRVEELAKKRGVSMSIIAISWVLSKGACPIVGFNKPERIHEAVEAVKFKLTEEEKQYLEEPYKPHEPTSVVVTPFLRQWLLPWRKSF